MNEDYNDSNVVASADSIKLRLEDSINRGLPAGEGIVLVGNIAVDPLIGEKTIGGDGSYDLTKLDTEESFCQVVSGPYHIHNTAFTNRIDEFLPVHDAFANETELPRNNFCRCNIRKDIVNKRNPTPVLGGVGEVVDEGGGGGGAGEGSHTLGGPVQPAPPRR